MHNDNPVCNECGDEAPYMSGPETFWCETHYWADFDLRLIEFVCR